MKILVSVLSLWSAMAALTLPHEKLNHPSVTSQLVSGTWSLDLNSTCSELAAEKCASGFHFVFQPDGQYRVETSDQELISSGKLTRREIRVLEEAFVQDPNDPNPERFPEACFAQSDLTLGELDRISWNEFSTEIELIRATQSHFCFRLSSAQNAQNLYRLLNRLAQKTLLEQRLAG